MSSIGKILYLLLPLILAGTFNMIFVKLPLWDSLKKPMDGKKILWDGERLFGDNKTWKGFIGMIVFTAFWLAIFGILAHFFTRAQEISLIPFHRFNTPFSELLFGAIWGFGYVLFELPNSFIKRRLKIKPGKQGRGFLGSLFTVIDQADSAVGCTVVMLVFYTPPLIDFIAIIVVATAVHYVVNILLYLAKLKKQAG